MKELKEPCKSMIANGKCLGCNKLELNYFEGDDKCVYVRSIKSDGIYNIITNGNINDFYINLFNNYDS